VCDVTFTKLSSFAAAAGRGRDGRQGGGGRGWRLRHRRRRLQQALRGQPEPVRRSALDENLYQIKLKYSEITYDHESVLRIRDVYPGS